MTCFRKQSALALSLVVLALKPAIALARPVLIPKSSEVGAYEKYSLRVPNERDVAITRVEIRFPRSVRVVSFAEVPGWTLEIVSDSAKHIIGAAWTGSLAPRRFVELSFIAVNPASALQLVWPVFQTYSTGERVDWAGPRQAKFAAPITAVGLSPKATPGIALALWVCVAAFALSIAGLVFALRPDGSAERFQPGS